MKRILLVDDDADILEALASLLEERYAVSVAQNGAIALRLVEASSFDAVILDLMMPILDGVGFVRGLKERGLQVPVILASAGRDLEKRVRELKVEDCLAKPFDISELEEKLERVMNGSQGGGTAPAQGGTGSDGRGTGTAPGREGRTGAPYARSASMCLDN